MKLITASASRAADPAVAVDVAGQGRVVQGRVEQGSVPRHQSPRLQELRMKQSSFHRVAAGYVAA